jgi:hypothetical protein
MAPPLVWTDAELATLREHYPKRGAVGMMALLLGRSQKGIQHKAYEIKVRMAPDAYIQHHRDRALRHSPERTAIAYQMRMDGKGWKEIAATLGYASHDTAGASVQSYCAARGLEYPKTPPRPQKKMREPNQPETAKAPRARNRGQATKIEARPSAPISNAPRYVAESPEEWLARNKPRRAEMVTMDVVMAWMRAKDYAPRRAGKQQDGERYHIRGFKRPLPARSLVDMANRLRIAADNGATQWIVSGQYAQPAGMLPRDCRLKVLRNVA